MEKKIEHKLEICKRFHTARKALELSQKEFSEQTGISRSYIGSVETGKQTPSFDFLMKVAKTFNISLDWLIFGKGQMLILEDDHFLNRLTEQQIELIELLFFETPKKLQISIFNLVSDFLDTLEENKEEKKEENSPEE